MARFSQINDTSLDALVRTFYGRVRLDSVLGPVFEAAVEDWEAHFEILTRFWSSVMLASGRYKGNPFGAHKPLPIEPAFFDRWLGYWGETARELFEPELAAAFVEKAQNIAESLKLGLFFRPQA